MLSVEAARFINNGRIILLSLLSELLHSFGLYLLRLLRSDLAAASEEARQAAESTSASRRAAE